MNQLQTSDQQVSETNAFFSKLEEKGQRLSYINKGEEFIHECDERK
jgi:tRNA-dihydrouridine synthase B